MRTPLPTRWNGYYYDGRTAQRHPAIIALTRDGLQITREAHTSIWWPIDQVRQTQGFTPGEHVRLERGGEFAEAIVVTQEGFLAAFREIAPAVARRIRGPAPWPLRFLVALAALIGVFVLGAAAYLWGIPALADAAASRVPVAWEERLGEQVVEVFVGRRARCRNPAQQQALDRIASTLMGAAPGSPYTIRVAIADFPAFNALAAPGGYVVIFRGLLEKTRTPEELAGVMAHEIQHVLHRDSTRAIFREVSLDVLLRVATGGGSASPLEIARSIGGLRYQRGDEDRADREGMKMVQRARIDAQGMVAVFELFLRESENMVEPPAYLSSHPRTRDRVEAMRRLAAQATYTPIALLPGVPWSEIKQMCQ